MTRKEAKAKLQRRLQSTKKLLKTCNRQWMMIDTLKNQQAIMELLLSKVKTYK